MRNVNEVTKALKTHPTVAVMISLLEAATARPIILTGEPGTFSIWSMRPEFDGFNAKDLGLECVRHGARTSRQWPRILKKTLSDF